MLVLASSGCLCVGVKMKNCTQLSDSGFRGKIHLVNPSDSAKRVSPGMRTGFSHRNAKRNPALLSPLEAMYTKIGIQLIFKQIIIYFHSYDNESIFF